MKKALGGCLIVGLLLLVVGGGATWWFVLRPAWNAGNQFLQAANQITELTKLEADVRNKANFSPPTDGRISDESLNRFLAVQRTIKDEVGPKLNTLEDKYKKIADDKKSSGKDPGVTELMQSYGDLFGLLRDAKKAQVNALNQQNLSLHEYRWVRTQAYVALAQEGLPSNADAAAPASNAQRLAPHRELLKETAVMAWLGL